MAKDVSKTDGTKPDSVTGIPLWIDEKWFIPVDEMGRCIGPCAEGALGFIVQLRCLDNPDHVLALKLPRLMGETYRENAYISDLMEKELKAVYDIHLGCGKPEGLMGSGYFGRGGPLKGTINSKNGPEDARKLHNGLLLVCFEKGHNPRFCAVIPDGDEVRCFPESVEACPVTAAEQLTKIEAEAQRADLPWSSPVFIEASVQRNRGPGSGPRIFSKDYALDKSPTGQT